MNSELEFIRQSVIRDMSEGVMTVGLDGKIVDINPAAAGILEKSAAELTGKPFAAAFFISTAFAAIISSLCASRLSAIAVSAAFFCAVEAAARIREAFFALSPS